MNITEIVGRTARRLNAPYDLAWGFVQETVVEIVSVLNQGEEVKIRGLGRIYWAKVKGKKITTPKGIVKECPPGWKLKFVPAQALQTRRESNVRKR